MTHLRSVIDAYRYVDQTCPLAEMEMRAVPLRLVDKSIEVNEELVRAAMKDIFLASRATELVAKQVLAVGQAHAHRFYTSPTDVVRDMYAPTNNWGDVEFPAIMLTGLSGVGKSGLVKALASILDARADAFDLPNHKGLEHVACWPVSVGESRTLNALIGPLLVPHHLAGAEKQTIPRLTQSKLLHHARRTTRRHATCLIVADEFQFQSNSSDASTAVTSLLLHLQTIGPRLVFVANFSLAHRLKSRRHEDRRRLLSHVIELPPEGAGSGCYLRLINEYCKVLPDHFPSNGEAVIEQIFRYTFGIKACAVELLTLAWSRAITKRGVRGKVGPEDLEAAFRSDRYLTQREDVEALFRHGHGATNTRSDLVNPLRSEISESSKSAAKEAAEAHAARVSKDHLVGFDKPKKQSSPPPKVDGAPRKSTNWSQKASPVKQTNEQMLQNLEAL